jgi:predicted lipoprotein with Yx(FWY)xxD motif
MMQRTDERSSRDKVSPWRIAGAAIALGGLSGVALVEGAASAATNVVVSTTKNAKLGTILVSGKTVYTLKASKTPCSTTCLKIWPALKLPQGVKKATAGKGVSAAKLGTVKMKSGALQVTYGGKALYYFSGDSAAGQVHGNLTDTWGKWSTVVTVKPASSGSGTSSNSGSGGSTAGSGGASF